MPTLQYIPDDGNRNIVKKEKTTEGARPAAQGRARVSSGADQPKGNAKRRTAPGAPHKKKENYPHGLGVRRTAPKNGATILELEESNDKSTNMVGPHEIASEVVRILHGRGDAELAAYALKRFKKYEAERVRLKANASLGTKASASFIEDLRRAVHDDVVGKAWSNLMKLDWDGQGSAQRGPYQTFRNSIRQREVKKVKRVDEEDALKHCKETRVVERRSIKDSKHEYLCSAHASDGSFKFSFGIPTWHAGSRVVEEDVIQAMVNVEAAIMAATRPGHFLDRVRGTKRHRSWESTELASHTRQV